MGNEGFETSASGLKVILKNLIIFLIQKNYFFDFRPKKQKYPFSSIYILAIFRYKFNGFNNYM